MLTFLGIGYVIAVVFIALRARKLALVLILAVAPIQRSIDGLPFRLAIGELNLIVISLAWFGEHVARRRAIRFGPLATPVLLYLAVCILSSIEDWRGNSAIISFVQMSLYLIIAVVAFSSYEGSLLDFRPAFHVLLIIGAFLSASVAWAGTGYVYGLNKNGVGSSLACVLIVGAELWLGAADPKWKRIYFFSVMMTVPGLMVTLSRGSWLAALAGLSVILILRRESKLLVRALLVLVPLITICWINLPAENREFAAGFDSKRENIHARLIFIDTATREFQKDPLLGVGLGFRKEYDSTNVILTTLAETGVLGLGAFLLIHIIFVWMIWKTCDQIPGASWHFSLTAIGASLIVAMLVHGFVDHYWSRGPLLLAWSGAGLATRIYFLSQARLRIQGMGTLERQAHPRRRLRSIPGRLPA